MKKSFFASFCARALGFAAFHRRDERMNENMLSLLLSAPESKRIKCLNFYDH